MTFEEFCDYYVIEGRNIGPARAVWNAAIDQVGATYRKDYGWYTVEGLAQRMESNKASGTPPMEGI